MLWLMQEALLTLEKLCGYLNRQLADKYDHWKKA
jgi:hypothetical protein